MTGIFEVETETGREPCSRRHEVRGPRFALHPRGPAACAGFAVSTEASSSPHRCIFDLTLRSGSTFRIVRWAKAPFAPCPPFGGGYRLARKEGGLAEPTLRPLG